MKKECLYCSELACMDTNHWLLIHTDFSTMFVLTNTKKHVEAPWDGGM